MLSASSDSKNELKRTGPARPPNATNREEVVTKLTATRVFCVHTKRLVGLSS